MTDPLPLRTLLGIDFDVVRREVSVQFPHAHRADRIDLLLERDGGATAVIEAKLLSNLGGEQLDHYSDAFPKADRYWVLHLAMLPVSLNDPWCSLTWEEVLNAYKVSDHPWVSATASAWVTVLNSVVPRVVPGTVWNDVPDDAPGLELALRARTAWIFNQVDQWCELEHDVVQSSGGGSWAVRIWGDAPSPQHLVTIELQEGLSAYEWKPNPDHPYRERLRGPVVLFGLRQDGVTTSADFDWARLHRIFTSHVVNNNDTLHDRAWQQTPARPPDPVDRQNWQDMVAAGAPPWLGKGRGMKAAKANGECLFGARYGLPPDSTLAQVDTELRQLAAVVASICSTPS